MTITDCVLDCFVDHSVVVYFISRFLIIYYVLGTNCPPPKTHFLRTDFNIPILDVGSRYYICY